MMAHGTKKAGRSRLPWRRPSGAPGGLSALPTLGLAASVAGGYRWRLRSVEARNQALAVEVAERTLQIAQRTADIEALYQADAELDRHVALSEVLQSLVDIAVEQLGA